MSSFANLSYTTLTCYDGMYMHTLIHRDSCIFSYLYTYIPIYRLMHVCQYIHTYMYVCHHACLSNIHTCLYVDSCIADSQIESQTFILVCLETCIHNLGIPEFPDFYISGVTYCNPSRSQASPHTVHKINAVSFPDSLPWPWPFSSQSPLYTPSLYEDAFSGSTC